MSNGSSVIYGINPVRESLIADQPFDKIYLLQNRRDKAIDEVRSLAKNRKVAVTMVKREQLDRMVQTSKHQGIVAYLSEGKYHDLENLLATARRKETPLFLFLIDGVEDPRNLGAIIRTVDAAGGDGVVIPSRRAAGLTSVVSKSSAGALAHLPVARVENLSSTLDQLKKEENLWVVGLDVEGEMPYTRYDFTGPVAIVVGGEGKGIRRKVLERCDQTVSLPMLGNVGSLNVSVAVGIVAYEVIKQRSCTR